MGHRRGLASGDPALKEQGKLRHFGISINDYQPENAIKLIETGVVDSVQVIYKFSSKVRKIGCFQPANATTSVSSSEWHWMKED